MSDDLKADVIAMLHGMVMPQGEHDRALWVEICQHMADQIIDRCMYGAVQAGAKAREEISRLESELEAAKMLIRGDVVEATNTLRKLCEHWEKEVTLLHALMATLVTTVRDRNLNEVIRITEGYALRMSDTKEDDMRYWQ